MIHTIFEVVMIGWIGACFIVGAWQISDWFNNQVHKRKRDARVRKIVKRLSDETKKALQGYENIQIKTVDGKDFIQGVGLTATEVSTDWMLVP